MKYKCSECEHIFDGKVQRHVMEKCTCGKSFIDVEEHYTRKIGYVINIDE